MSTAVRTRDEVYEVLRSSVLAVRPDLDPELVRPESSLVDLDFSSLDRLDVVVGALDELGLPPHSEVVEGVNDLGELAEALHAAVVAATAASEPPTVAGR